ncbi:MAG: 2-hydroxychromene-2-carboxylate isomerase [Gammaproteobacteria bacterium AqS3]|nr:2-hydroxychromene-2-carboxylate isomerase [Gammaproteobacteria bacterium AqS3]
MRVDFFFDCSSPWTYLAFDRIGPLCRELRADLVYRPVLVGGVFNQVNRSVYESRQNPVPAKARYFRDDLQLWADYQGLKISWPEVFPVNSVKAMRGAFLAIERGCLEPYARRVFELYWGQARDISQEDVLLEALTELPIQETEFLAWCGSDEARRQLRDNTQELIDRGGFGSPTMLLDGRTMLFGNDRMELLRALISGAPG